MRKTKDIFQEEYSHGIINIVILFSIFLVIAYSIADLNIVLAILISFILTLASVYLFAYKQFKKIILKDDFFKIVYMIRQKEDIIKISSISHVTYTEHLSRSPSFIRVFLNKKKVKFKTQTPEDASQILLYFHNKNKKVEITPSNGIVHSKFNELIDKSSDSFR